MTRWRCLLLFLTLSTGTLLTSLPSAQAQRPPGCPCSGAMHVHTYYVQQKFLIQQQQQMHQMHVAHQQRMMMQAQQIRQARMEQVRQRQQQMMVAKSRTVQQQQTRVATPGRTAVIPGRSATVHTKAMQVRTEARVIHPPHRPGSVPVRMLPRVLKTEARTVYETARKVHQDPVRVAMAPKVVHQEIRKVHTEARQVHTEARQVHTDIRKVHTEARQVRTEARKIVSESTQTVNQQRWCVKTVKVVEVTYDLNCGQCHGNKRKPTPEPMLVKGPARRPTPEPILVKGPPRKPTPEPLFTKAPVRKPTREPVMAQGPPRKVTPEPLLPRRPVLLKTPTAIALTKQPPQGSREVRLKEPLAQTRHPNQPRHRPTHEPLAQGPGPRRPQTALREAMRPDTPGAPPWRRPLSEPVGVPGLPPGPGQLAMNDPWGPYLPGQFPDPRMPFDRGQLPLWEQGDDPTQGGTDAPRPGKKQPGKTGREAVTMEDDTSLPLPASVLQSPFRVARGQPGLREGFAEGSSAPEAAPQQGRRNVPVTGPFWRPLTDADLLAPDLPPLPRSIIVPPVVDEEEEDLDLPAPSGPDRIAGTGSASGA
jgi:hypothetical protein